MWGTERVISKLCDHMIKDYEVYIVVYKKNNIISFHPHVKLIEIYKYENLKVFLELIKPDIFFMHQYWGLKHLKIIELVKQYNITVGLFYHTCYAYDDLIKNNLLKKRVDIYKKLDVLICLNNETAKNFLTNDNITSIVINNPMTFEFSSYL